VNPSRPTTVAIIGGGIAGLAAAWELVSGTTTDPPPTVHVYESEERLGGKLRSTQFAGRTVDLAADAFLARRPEATDLCTEIGVDGELVPVGASGAAIWARGRLRPMPDCLNLGIPTRWWPLVRSGIVSPAEALYASRDLLGLHRGNGADTGDRSVGDIVTSRLGRPVTERLADPLIGGINAGGVDSLSVHPGP
jgi:oxygen-dependent protoporphyrinogen oxidase